MTDCNEMPVQFLKDKAIGGYFGLELSLGQGELYPNALHFQSARAAFLALLIEFRPACVWMPAYICDSMLEPLKQADIPWKFFAQDNSFTVDENVTLEPDEWLLYVNYFGVCNHQVARTLERFPRQQVIIDNSQAFYSRAPDCLGVIYSPRKYFGVPDGGYLITERSIAEPVIIDKGSYDRTAHLIKRIAFDAESGYPDFHVAEDSLSQLPPMRMSQLTQHILTTIDYEFVRQCRMDNFRFLHKHLGVYNSLDLSPDEEVSPLCYPLFCNTLKLAEQLATSRIFLPTYWRDTLKRCTPSSAEYSFVHFILPLPVDQRYGHEELEIIVGHVDSAVRGGGL